MKKLITLIILITILSPLVLAAESQLNNNMKVAQTQMVGKTILKKERWKDGI